VILAYMIASTVLVLSAGRLSDLFGRKNVYVGGFALFGLASLGAGFAAADGRGSRTLAASGMLVTGGGPEGRALRHLLRRDVRAGRLRARSVQPARCSSDAARSSEARTAAR
jgi:hypothetical protein